MQTVTFIKKNVLAATRVKVKCSMHQKEKPVLFMPVPYRSIDMLLVSCEELPCAIWKETRDPLLSDEIFESSIHERMQNLKEIGY